MVSKFWDKIAEGVAGKWTAQALGPALAFWGGGFLAWVFQHGWQPLIKWLDSLNNIGVYITIAVVGLLILVASSAAVERLQFLAIRLGEGYWPGPFRHLRFVIAKNIYKKIVYEDECWQVLANKPEAQRSAEEQDEYARLDAELATFPLDPRSVMPTRLGNILRAAEEYPNVRYGLVAGVCWPRLWLLLSKETQATLSQARQELNSAARLLIWGAVFAVWTVWAWWVLPVAIITVVAAYWSMTSAAGVYGELLRAAFDLYRPTLYKQLRLPLPVNPAVEVTNGSQLSEYLFRGSANSIEKFISPEEKENG